MGENKNALDIKEIEAYLEFKKPIWHFTVDLGINEFKKKARETFGNGALANKLIKAFKRRAWMEYKGVARHRGSYPVHPNYGSDVAVDEQTEETVVKVNNGTKQK